MMNTVSNLKNKTIFNKAMPRFKSNLVALSLISQIIMVKKIFIKVLKNDTQNSNVGMELSLLCLKGAKITNDS